MWVSWVACSYALALGLLFAGCHMVMRSMRGLRGLRSVQWAIAMAMLSSLARMLHFRGLPLAGVIGNNYLFLAYLLLVYRASAQLLQKGSRPTVSRMVWGIVAAWIAGLPLFWYFTDVHRDAIARILVGTVLKAMTAGMTALLCLRGTSVLPRERVRALGALHLSFAGLNLGRILATVVHPPGNWRYLDPVQTGFTYAQLLCCFATCGGIVWLSIIERNAELQRQAETDSLTGLLNRRAFETVLAQEMERCREQSSAIALVMVDLDHFKAINDTFGHFTGDEVLRRVSDVLKQGVRAVDTLARFGGEEFVVLLRDATPEGSQVAAERLRLQIEEIVVAGGKPKITASLGLAISRAQESPGALMDRCDQALYRSKRSGRNLLTVCPPS